MTPPRPIAWRLPEATVAGMDSALRQEWEELVHETDPQLYQEGVLNLAGRQEQAGHYQAAAEFYRSLSEVGSPGIRDRAQARLDAIVGRGALGNRAEFLLRTLAEQAADPSALLAMGVAGTVFRMTRLASLSRLATSTNPGFLTRLLGAGRVASLFGFAAEAPAFALTGRLASEALGRPQDWSARGVGRDFASSYLVLGGLKFAGVLGRAATTRVGNVHSLSTLFQQASLLGGILLGHQAETWAGLRAPRNSAMTVVDSLAMLLQFHVAGNLLRTSAWSAQLEAQADLVSRLPPGGGSGNPIQLPVADLALEGAGLGAPESIPTSDRPSIGISIVQMSGRGSRSHWTQDLNNAMVLRQRIAPPEAYERRNELAAKYVEKILALPPGQTDVLMEFLSGIEMFHSWATGGDAFRRAIAFRHYSQLWEGLAAKWSHSNLNVRITEDLRTQMQAHRGLLARDENPKFYAAILKAAPQIARIYSHTLPALIVGSPRERELSADHLQLLSGLRLRFSGASQEANRALLVEAFHDTLNNTADERIDFAREAMQGIQAMRRWIHNHDGERQALGRRYYPLFWERLSDRGHPDLKENVLAEVGEEIAFLQQNLSLFRRPKETSPPAIQAFPYYVRFVLGVMAQNGPESLSLMSLFLTHARDFRSNLQSPRDPEIREVCAVSYLKLMRQLDHRLTFLEAEGARGPFPFHPLRPLMAQELWAAVPDFETRWNAAAGKALAPALRDYTTLLELLPVLPEYRSALTSEAHLKPIVRLGYHADAEVRDAAGEAIAKILQRFSPNSQDPPPRN